MVDSSSSESEVEDDGVDRAEQMRLLYSSTAAPSPSPSLGQSQVAAPHSILAEPVHSANSETYGAIPTNALTITTEASDGAGAAVGAREVQWDEDGETAQRKRQRMSPSPAVSPSSSPAVAVSHFQIPRTCLQTVPLCSTSRFHSSRTIYILLGSTFAAHSMREWIASCHHHPHCTVLYNHVSGTFGHVLGRGPHPSPLLTHSFLRTLARPSPSLTNHHCFFHRKRWMVT